MRVALVCPYSLGVPGGVQGQVLGLAEALRRRGHRATVLAPCDGPPPGPGVIPIGASVPFRVNGSVAPLAPSPAAFVRVVRQLRRERFDVVHIHEPFAPGATLGVFAARRAPLVATFHAAGDRTPYRYGSGPLRRLARHIAVGVAVSEEARLLAERALGGSYDVIPNAVDVAGDPHVTAAPTDGPTILFIGRHEPRKGLEVLLAAMAFLPANTRLWVAGTGPDTARLRRRFAGDARIVWLGPISEDDKQARLRAASVLCAPSLHGESFGVVLLEAMAAGTPVVASDLPGYRAAAGAPDTVVLVPPGQPAALAAALARVIADPGVADALRAGGFRRARACSTKVLAERYLACYRRAIGAGSGQRTGACPA